MEKISTDIQIFVELQISVDAGLILVFTFCSSSRLPDFQLFYVFFLQMFTVQLWDETV